MILWLALFLLVIAISFVLALQSMADYHELPLQSKVEYGLFLIRRSSSLTVTLLDSLHREIVKEGLIISIERLFKGQQAALVIFGPKKILANFAQNLDLLELEDYAYVNRDYLHAWEIGVKGSKKSPKIENFFKHLPLLSSSEQFWWQLTLQATEKDAPLFKSQIRAVVFSEEPNRRKKLADGLQSLTAGHLTKVPKPFTSDQIINFYQQRSIGVGETNPLLTSEQVSELIHLPHA